MNQLNQQPNQQQQTQENKPLSKQEREKLVSDNIGLIKKVVKLFKPKSPSIFDEYMSAGYMGMAKAINTFNPSIAQFSTWAWWYVKWEIMRYITKEKSFKDKNQLFPSESMDLKMEKFATQLDIDDIEESIPDYLSSQERYVVRAKASGDSFSEISESINEPKQIVKYIFKVATEKIKAANV